MPFVLSPASLRSHWVLVELGGALALKKVIVPILMYIGPNEVPDPIKRLLARDINDIDKYYDQLRRQLTSGQSPKPSKPRPQRTRQTSFKVGDKVRIPEAGGDRVQEIVWNPDGEMNKFLGREATVTRLYSNFGARLDIDDGQFVWAFDWLRPSPKASRGRAAG